MLAVTVGMIVALLLAGSGGGPVMLAQLTIRQQLIIRVPSHVRRPADPVLYREKNGPKCISAGELAGAQISNYGVDLLLRGGNRVRAKLAGDCPPLDYYSGFYIRQGLDGQVCAERDSIRVRSGGSCEIERFRKLVPLSKK
ncbi:hypothetical protein SCH01S_01_01430 [Sphingomonas changbaiensis NBRC 104936]|uniref:Uncharacterized protein n=1 Tax=Sphingomonas changbaiensis NBRC 104936 TaxID=1219043 RepID=A0A0E9MLI0_9SPHN|nr:hypothetical protein SCH01S_01_01430 [Sphingomonas changbaiensis NBRC 104936]